MVKIDVLYEDDDCAVINKPAGIMVHADNRSNGPFLADWIVATFPTARGVGEMGNGQDGKPVDRSGIVHRLDRDTSGAMIVAKTDKGYRSLKEQFQNREVTKKYLAFVWGEVEEEFGTVNRPIGRSGRDFRKWIAGRGIRGEVREAETYWTRIWTGNEPDKNERLSLILAEPRTGRTHQIRVHFNALNHPVVGDMLYAPKRPFVLGFDRLALHSYHLFFKGISGSEVTVKAPLSADFAAALAKIGLNLESLKGM